MMIIPLLEHVCQNSDVIENQCRHLISLRMLFATYNILCSDWAPHISYMVCFSSPANLNAFFLQLSLQQFEAALMSHRHNICLRPDVDRVKRQGKELPHPSAPAELVGAWCALCYLSLDSRHPIDGMSPGRVSRIPLLLVLCKLWVCRSHTDSILIKVSCPRSGFEMCVACQAKGSVHVQVERTHRSSP